MTEKTFPESGFLFDFSLCINAYIADKPNYNGLSAVDFIVETSDAYFFIGIKPTGCQTTAIVVSED